MFSQRAQISIRYAIPHLRQKSRFARCHYSTKSLKPLRILFCGSDEFSCASLQAVHDEKVRGSSNIASIDVLCRPGKPSGRGMKTIRHAPIRSLAERLGTPIHERDTFTGWNIPARDGEAINLLIAVSFGLFVPPRVLKSVEYGGLNVHPSLLPDLRGPAPLHHALLNGDRTSGITLQTLDPKRFDHGKILLQEPLSIPSNCTYPDLLTLASHAGPKLLISGLRQAVYDPSYVSPSFPSNSQTLRHAPKVSNSHREIDFQTSSINDILRKDQVLSKLWFTILTSQDPNSPPRSKRVILSGLTSTPLASLSIETPLAPASITTTLTQSTPPKSLSTLSAESTTPSNKPTTILAARFPASTDTPSNGRVILWRAGDEEALTVDEITVEGGRKVAAAEALFFPGTDRYRFG